MTSAGDLDHKICRQSQHSNFTNKSESDLLSTPTSQEQTQSNSFKSREYISSAANSNSNIYAGLLLEKGRGRKSISPENQIGFSALNEEDKRGQALVQLLSHHSVMGGNVDNSHRSSSPLKRRASDLENESVSSMKDVEMLSIHSSTSPVIDKQIVQLTQENSDKSFEPEQEKYTVESMNSEINTEQQILRPASNKNGDKSLSEQVKILI